MEAMVFDFACNNDETDKNEETEGNRYKLTDDNGAEAEAFINLKVRFPPEIFLLSFKQLQSSTTPLTQITPITSIMSITSITPITSITSITPITFSI